MKSRFISTIGLIALMSLPVFTQQPINIPNTGWRLWLDKDAAWENDTIYLPADADLSKLPSNQPKGGWDILNSTTGISVTLPSTVEEHFWGTNGFRKYRDEYFYETQDTAAKNGNYLGVSWWWKEIDIPKSYAGKQVILFIRGARLRAEVYLNRQLVGYNIITETSFTCDASLAVKPGAKNLLAIRITNPGGRLDWLDTQLMSWGKTNQNFHKSRGFGGLDRGITISAHDKIFIADLWTLNTPQLNTLQVHATINNTTGKKINAVLRIELIDPDSSGKICLKQEKIISIEASPSSVTTDVTYPGALLWNVDTPKLYRLRATILPVASGKKNSWKDTHEVTTGIRWFEADSIGSNAVLRFNGNRIRITSAISWGFWGINGLWPTAKLAEREVRAAKSFGMNCIQFHRNVGKTEVLDAHDRLGLFRYMEPGGGQTSFGEKFNLYAPSPKDSIDDSGKAGDAQTFAEKYMEEKIVRMVRDHRSHPSLLLYSIQNEIHPDLHNPRVFRILRRIHEEDPSRIVVVKSGFPSGSPSMNQAWMQPYSNVVLHDTGDAYSGWWDDHTVGGPGVWRDEMYKSPIDFTHRSTNDKEIVMWGEMLGAAAPDNHQTMVEMLKGVKLQSYDLKDHEEILNSYNKFIDRWGFRKAFPTADALFTSIGNKSYDFWGRVIETARLAESNDYFVISGWESTAIENHSGLLDNLRGYKGNPDLIKDRLAPLRAAIKSKSLVYKVGEEIFVDLYLINETNKRHSSTVIVWTEDNLGNRRQIAMMPVQRFSKDQFVYQIATTVSIGKFDHEGSCTVHVEVPGSQPQHTSEKFLIIDPVGKGQLPRSVGILSTSPNLQMPIEIFPDVVAEPYQREKKYELVIAANRFTRPADTGTDPATEIAGTDDDELYRTINYGDPSSIEFLFPGLPNDTAKVTLKFAELFQNAADMRVFDVALNSTIVLKDFDVFKGARGKNIAYDRTFQVPITNHILQITFPNVPKPSARICAIKIECGDTVIAVNCGGKKYVDHSGLMWRPYEPPTQFDKQLLEKVRTGLPILILSEGDAATEKYASELGDAGAIKYIANVGEARASWMGSWYFVRQHPVYDGLPVDCGMDSYYQVPVTNAGGVVLDGADVDVFAGYSRDHDRSVGAASFSTSLGKGKILFHSIPGMVSGLNGESTGIHPVMMKRLLANSMRFLMNR